MKITESSEALQVQVQINQYLYFLSITIIRNELFFELFV